VAFRRARIVGRNVEPFGGHAGAGDCVQIATAEPPHAAEFTAALVIILAGIGAPGPDPRFATPHLGDDAAARAIIGRMVGVNPVPAVGAHIHEATAALHVIVDGVE